MWSSRRLTAQNNYPSHVRPLACPWARVGQAAWPPRAPLQRWEWRNPGRSLCHSRGLAAAILIRACQGHRPLTCEADQGLGEEWRPMQAPHPWACWGVMLACHLLPGGSVDPSSERVIAPWSQATLGELPDLALHPLWEEWELLTVHGGVMPALAPGLESRWMDRVSGPGRPP